MFLAQLEALLVLLGILFVGYSLYRIWFKKPAPQSPEDKITVLKKAIAEHLAHLNTPEVVIYGAGDGKSSPDTLTGNLMNIRLLQSAGLFDKMGQHLISAPLAARSSH